MTIHIEDLTFSTIIGILDFERVTPQDVIIDARIDYCYEENTFINYAEVIALIEKEVQQEKYELLEDALSDISNKLLKKYTKIKNIYLKITKPDIITNAKVSLSLNIKN
jgi:dihydroneopterin aldolase